MRFLAAEGLCGLIHRFSYAAFWDAFWPNMAATFVGAALGIPAALWINRMAVRAANRQEHLREAQRLDTLATTMQATIEHNTEPLRTLADLSPESVCWVTGLEHAIWETSRDDVVSLLPQFELKVDLARYFENLVQLEKLNERYTAMFTEPSDQPSHAFNVRMTIHSLITAIARQSLGRSRRVKTSTPTDIAT
jgi:hypothetical protein